MSNRSRLAAISAVASALTVGFAPAPLQESTKTKPADGKKGAAMQALARGTFEVKLAPFPLAEPVEGSNLGRMTINKSFQGDLEGSSIGEMLSAMTSVKGSAGYVAIERVTGKLAGREGTFVLQHSATMTRGKPDLSVFVVPDSGTGGLVGISGKLKIIIEGGKHSYEFEYTLSDVP